MHRQGRDGPSAAHHRHRPAAASFFRRPVLFKSLSGQSRHRLRHVRATSAAEVITESVLQCCRLALTFTVLCRMSAIGSALFAASPLPWPAPSAVSVDRQHRYLYAALTPSTPLVLPLSLSRSALAAPGISAIRIVTGHRPATPRDPSAFLFGCPFRFTDLIAVAVFDCTLHTIERARVAISAGFVFATVRPHVFGQAQGSHQPGCGSSTNLCAPCLSGCTCHRGKVFLHRDHIAADAPRSWQRYRAGAHEQRRPDVFSRCPDHARCRGTRVCRRRRVSAPSASLAIRARIARWM